MSEKRQILELKTSCKLRKGRRLEEENCKSLVRNEEGGEDREVPTSSISKEKTTLLLYYKERS